MNLGELSHFETHGDVVRGCFVMCPTCEVGSNHREWLYDYIYCSNCAGGDLDAVGIECPDCGVIHCADCGPVLDIGPPFDGQPVDADEE